MDYIERRKACEKSGDYDSAINYGRAAASELEKLARTNSDEYEPYLYAQYDDLCIMYFNHKRMTSVARDYEQKALAVAQRCERRQPGRYKSDIALFEKRLKNDLQ